MQYDIPLPKAVNGSDLILALEQVAQKWKWEYTTEITAYSVNLRPTSPPYELRSKTLQLCISHKESHPDVRGDLRGQMTILVSPNERYTALTVHNVGTDKDIMKIPCDLIPQRTLDSFVSSLHNQLLGHK